MRSWLRRQPGWVDLRRWQREGFRQAFQRWRLYSKVLETSPVRTANSGGDTELHLLCYRNDYLGAMWSLKSFYHFVKAPIPLIIHIQGEAGPRMLPRLRTHFPDARVVCQNEADSVVIPTLRKRGLKRLLRARTANHYTLKLTDFLLLGDAPNLLTFDGDVLFFKNPEAFLRPTRKHVFQRDPESNYVMPPDRAWSEFGIEMAARINVGMMHFQRESISLERCDQYLAAFPTFEGWLEQTLYAMHASEKRNLDYLPHDYLISLEPGLDHSKLVARHYAGPSRHLLHKEGIPYLMRDNRMQLQPEMR